MTEKIWQALIDASKNKSAASAIEYGLIAAGIAVAIVSVVNILGVKLEGTFTNITAAIK